MQAGGRSLEHHGNDPVDAARSGRSRFQPRPDDEGAAVSGTELGHVVMQPGHVVEFQLRVDLTIHELQLGRAVGRQLRPGNSARRVTFSVLWVVYGWM